MIYIVRLHPVTVYMIYIVRLHPVTVYIYDLHSATAPCDSIYDLRNLIVRESICDLIIAIGDACQDSITWN